VIRAKAALLTGFLVATILSAPVVAYAQHGGGGGGHHGGGAVVVAAPYYSYNPWWYGGWYAYPYFGPYIVGYDNSASLRIQVEPRETEVYVDGYYAGTVNDFDGFFQRLHVQPGSHEVELYLDGYRTVRQQVYLQPGTTFKIHYAMERLQAGDTAGERPTPQAAPPEAAPAPGAPPPPPPPVRQPSVARPEPGSPPPATPPADSSFGSLVVQVQPGDAEILIDGEPWQSAGSARLVVQLSAGDHRVEVRKNGFETYRSTVRIRRGETTPLNVSLAQE
jgi:hypothetical protein